MLYLALRHECLLTRAETPLKDRYTLIEHSNTLIEQSDHLATETRDTGIKKEQRENFLRNSGRSIR